MASYDNTTDKNADGYHGWPEHSPFDAIVVAVAGPHIPPPLIEQLKKLPHGHSRRIAVRTQQLVLVEKKDGRVTTRNVLPLRFVPIMHAEAAKP